MRERGSVEILNEFSKFALGENVGKGFRIDFTLFDQPATKFGFLRVKAGFKGIRTRELKADEEAYSASLIMPYFPH